MTRDRLGAVVQCLRTLASGAGNCTDAQLLERFALEREEAAFAALMKRHGPMVLAVCRRVAGHLQDAEDAFQATFLILARKARNIRRKESVASWLHGVAYRAALKARRAVARRQRRENKAARRLTAVDKAASTELQSQLDVGLERLPDKYRLALVLCYFEGLTVDEAARELGCPRGTVASRLAYGRVLLRRQLAHHGLVLSLSAVTTLLLAGSAPAAVTPALLESTLRASIEFAAGQAAKSVVSSPVAGIVAGGLRSMFLSSGKAVAFLLVGLGALVLGAGVFARQGGADLSQTRAEPTSSAAANTAQAPERKARADAFGDPLPEGALARLGTLRFRHPQPISFLAFSGDGKNLISQAPDGVRVWEASTGKELRHLPAPTGNFKTRVFGAYSTCDLSPYGMMIAAFQPSGEGVGLWDLATGRQTRELQQSGPVPLVRFSPDGNALLTAEMGPKETSYRLWDVATGKALHSWKTPAGTTPGAVFSPDGKTVITADGDNTLRFWDLATHKQVREMSTGSKPAGRLALSPDGKLLASLGSKTLQGPGGAVASDDSIRIWDVAAGKELRPITPPKVNSPFDGVIFSSSWGIREFAFSPDGKTLITNGPDTVLRIWDPRTAKELRRIPLDTFTALGLACSPDGNILAAAANVSTIRLFDAHSGRDLAPPGPHQNHVIVALSGDGKTVVTASFSTIAVWDARTGRQRHRLDGHTAFIDTISLGSDGRTLYSTSLDKSVRAWDVVEGKELRRLEVYAKPSNLPARAAARDGIRFAPDGKTMALMSEGAVALLDTATGKEVKRLPAHEPYAASFIEDGKKLVVCTGDYKVHLWDLDSGKKIQEYPFPASGPGPGRWPFPRLVPPDGRLIYYRAQADPKKLVLMDVVSGQEIASLTLDGIFHMALSPDGRTLAWAGGDGPAVHLVEIASGKERRQLVGHRGRVSSLAYSADGRILVSGSMDTTAVVWDLAGTAKNRPLSAQQFETCWTDLAGQDAVRAYESIRKLAADPLRSPAFLDKRMHRPTAVDEKHLTRLIADLDSTTFAVRDEASRALGKLGEQAVPAIRQALKKGTAIEVRNRLERLLERAAQERRNPPPDLIQALRALEVLEMIGTPEARKVVARISQGAADARLTVEAKATLARIR